MIGSGNAKGVPDVVELNRNQLVQGPRPKGLRPSGESAKNAAEAFHSDLLATASSRMQSTVFPLYGVPRPALA
jgi:hypothetical protein